MALCWDADLPTRRASPVEAFVASRSVVCHRTLAITIAGGPLSSRIALVSLVVTEGQALDGSIGRLSRGCSLHGASIRFLYYYWGPLSSTAPVASPWGSCRQVAKDSSRLRKFTNLWPSVACLGDIGDFLTRESDGNTLVTWRGWPTQCRRLLGCDMTWRRGHRTRRALGRLPHSCPA